MRSYIVEHFSMIHVLEHNRIFGLDPLDWLILLTGSALSGAIAFLI
jgi:hypothetical protein